MSLAMPNQSDLTFTLTVDHRQSLADMIAAGKYDWVNEHITARNFPHDPADPSEVEVLLVHFGRILTTAEVLAKLDERGLRPATLSELCVLGADQPELQREFLIVALSSSWRDPDGYVYCPLLNKFGARRRLDLRWRDPQDGWRGFFRFLAASK